MVDVSMLARGNAAVKGVGGLLEVGLVLNASPCGVRGCLLVPLGVGVTEDHWLEVAFGTTVTVGGPGLWGLESQAQVGHLIDWSKLLQGLPEALEIAEGVTHFILGSTVVVRCHGVVD